MLPEVMRQQIRITNMKKRDFILAAVILVIAAAFYVTLNAGKKAGDEAVVMVAGEEVKVLPLNQNITYDIPVKDGHNRLVIQDGYADMTEADCRDGICVKHKKIHNNNETIVCLPHKVVVEIRSNDHSELDGIAG